MRRVAVALLAFGVCAPFAGGAPAAGRCGGRLPQAPAGLPAPVAITTGCGRFAIDRDGRITRTPNRLPVPRGAAWYPADGAWYKLEDGHLVVGRWHRRLWRSQSRFTPGYDIGALTIGPHALAFSYGNSTRLFVAGLGSPEREVADGEYPLGWTRAGALFTRARRGGELRLRHASGDLARTLATGIFDYAFDGTNAELDFVDSGRVLRTDGSAPVAFARLRRLGLSRRPELDPLGRLLALRDQRRIVVLRRDGSLLASTTVPRRRSRVDGVSSPMVAARDSRSVAFALTRGNTAYGSRGSETVYVLRAGKRRATAVYSVQLRFAVCERGADLAWHGRWLLYSASEGNVVVMDGPSRRRMLDLTRTVLRLPGSHGGEGHANVTASWSGRPS
jgi:hypothetical protein